MCSVSSHYEKILATGEVKCIDDEVPFEIPKGWEWCRLRDLCTVFGRIGFRGYTRNDIVDKGFGAITLSPSNMQDNGNMNYSVVSYVSWKKYEESPEIKIKTNDVLIVKTGSSYGKTCIITDLPEKATINPQIAVLKYSFVNNLWLTYCLNAPFAQEQFRKYVIGTSIPTFSQEKLSSTLLPLPPKNEQEHLTKKLSLLDKWIGSYNGIQQFIDRLNMDIYYKLKKSILQEALQGKLVPQIAGEGTAQELLEQIKAEKRRLVKEGKLKKSALNDSFIFRGDDNKYYEQVGKKCLDITEKIPFEIPKSWQWIRFDQGISLLSGRDLEPSRYNDLHHGIPYITGASNFVNSDLLVNRWTDSPITISDKGDLLLTCKGTIGSMAFNNIGQIHIARQVMAITSFGIDLKYIKCFLQSNLSILEKNANSMIPGISRNTLLDMLFPLPPIKEQQRIVAQIEKLFEQLR